jgi:hypothetical protein
LGKQPGNILAFGCDGFFQRQLPAEHLLLIG